VLKVPSPIFSSRLYLVAMGREEKTLQTLPTTGLGGLSGVPVLLCEGVLGVEGDMVEPPGSPPDLPLSLPVWGVLGPVPAVVLGEVFPLILGRKEADLPKSI